MVHFFLDVARRVERRRLAHAAGAPRRSRAVPARPRARLRPPARQPGHAAHPRGLYRGRGDRPGALRVLPLARHQREAALRHDGVERAGVHPAGRRREARHGGNAAARRRAADQRLGRGHVPEPGRLRRLLQEPRGHAGDARGRLDPLGRRGGHRQGRPPAGSSTGPRTSAGSPTAPSSRPSTSRTSSSSRPTSRRPCASGRGGRSSPRSSTSTSGRWGAGRSGGTSPTRATPISPRSPRCTS